MKSLRYIVIALIVILSLGGVWYWQSKKLTPTSESKVATSLSQIQTNTSSALPERTPDGRIVQPDSRLGPYAGLSAEELWKRKPKMEKAKTYPPQTPEEIDRWQWFRAMNKADPTFEVKTPIEFYGKVVDQNGNPISSADVDVNWTVLNGTKSQQFKTRGDGLFEIKGLHGSGISIQVSKEGYLPGRKSFGDFDYGDFSSYRFFVPDPKTPVVFDLLLKGESEPMYKIHLSRDLNNEKPLWIDIKTGKTGDQGDVSFTYVRRDPALKGFSGYTITIQTAEGGGLCLSQGEKYLFHAPDNYVPEIKIDQKAGSMEDPTFQVSKNIRFYLKTSDNKYAALEVNIGQFNDPGAGLTADIYFNPSGSHNLEFDPQKELVH
jgi:hypothetical protein